MSNQLLENAQAVLVKNEDIFLDEVEQRGVQILSQNQNFYIIQKPQKPIYFAQNIYEELSFVTFESIKDAAKILKSIQPLWVHQSLQYHRRGELIREHLIPIKQKQLDFPATTPKGNLGAYAVWDQNTLLIMKKSSHPLPYGEVLFHENRTEPPSRAYLKLWELFSLYVTPPQKNEVVLDLGSSPGGWTWVLAKLGLQVISVDKAPLHESLTQMPNVKFLQESAFGLDPKAFAHAQWIFSDIIAYPDAIYALIQKWLQIMPQAQLVFTIKLQGKTDFQTLDLLAEIPHARIFHLYHNKHEVCWVYKRNV